MSSTSQEPPPSYELPKVTILWIPQRPLYVKLLSGSMYGNVFTTQRSTSSHQT